MPDMAIVTSEIITDDNDKRCVKVTTRKCMVCNETGTVILSSADWENFHRFPEQFIQNTLRDATPDDREQIMTGIHGPCFDSMFGEPEDDGVSVTYCHCGQLTMGMEPETSLNDREVYGDTLFYGYCHECADSRCDTTNGMMDGCPNG